MIFFNNVIYKGIKKFPFYSILECEDRLVKVSPLLEFVDDWEGFIGGQIAERDVSLLRRHERTSRPLGGESFIDRLERALSRRLHKQKPGPKSNPRNR